MCNFNEETNRIEMWKIDQILVQECCRIPFRDVSVLNFTADPLTAAVGVRETAVVHYACRCVACHSLWRFWVTEGITIPNSVCSIYGFNPINSMTLKTLATSRGSRNDINNNKSVLKDYISYQRKIFLEIIDVFCVNYGQLWIILRAETFICNFINHFRFFEKLWGGIDNK